MIKIKVKVTGLKEIQSGLQMLEAGLKDTSELAYRAGLVIEAQAKANASGRPGPYVQTGTLKSSIVTSLASPVKAIVGTHLVPHYAPDVEYGHKQTMIGIGKKTGKPYGRYVGKIGRRLISPTVRAYPFFFKSIEQSKDKIAELVQSWVNKLLRK